tara:strand:+ start:3466 stop:3894 length:429 start_codon:yes stop_codon:yes gene_type:complete
MKHITKHFILPFLSILLFLVGCEDNNTEEPNAVETGTLSGAITFSGTWPDSGEVLLTLDTQYPPMGPPAGSRSIQSNQLVDNKYDYYFEGLAFGDYAALTVTYWPNDYSSGSSNYSLLASYINTISLSVESPELTIDLNADF